MITGSFRLTGMEELKFVSISPEMLIGVVKEVSWVEIAGVIHLQFTS